MTMPTYDVLTTRVPFGGFGRHLTSTEVRRARVAGVSRVSTRCIVVQWMNADYLGILYRPTSATSFSNAGVRLGLA